MNLLNFVQLVDNTVVAVDKDATCGGMGPIIRIVKEGIFPILQIGIPIILIVLGTMDLGKAVIASDEKQVKEAQGRLMKRCIYAVAVFFIVTIVNLLMSVVVNIAGNSIEGGEKWRDCWNNPDGGATVPSE